MAFEEFAVRCETLKQRNEVIIVLEGIGYKKSDTESNDNELVVGCYEDGEYMTVTYSCILKKLTYRQFMEKYSNKGGAMSKQLMISIIDAAKKQLNLGNSELSLKLGHNRNYISRVLRQENPTVEQMTKVVDKVKALVAEQKLPCGKPLPEFKHTPVVDAVMVSKDEYSEMYSKNTALCVEVGHLKKEVEYKNQVLDKRNAVLENHIERVNELELQLKTTQQKFIDVVDQKDSEIKKLQNDCNHATNQYQGKRAQVVRLNEKLNKQAAIYLIIIVAILLISIMGFAS